MKFSKLAYILFVFYLSLFSSCSSNNDSNEPDEIIIIENGDDENAGDDGNNDGGGTTVSLAERFVFDENIVIEHSFNTGGCSSPPCDTDEDSLLGIFTNAVPDDSYFYLSDDESELNLECQSEKGRRAEFKQTSEGPLSSFSKIEFEGIYYDIPNNGVTIAQVHNRGGNSNKPFFRLVLRDDVLETVIRKDPEVSSSDTSFQKEEFSFVGNADYDESSLHVVLEKSNGFVNITVIQNGTTILDKSYAPDTTTDWVRDNGIANGYYLKAGLYNDDGPHTKSLVVGYSTVSFSSNDR